MNIHNSPGNGNLPGVRQNLNTLKMYMKSSAPVENISKIKLLKILSTGPDGPQPNDLPRIING